MRFSVPIRIIEIEQSGYHVAITGFVNGNLANILIDTGASQTVFDKNRIELFSKNSELEKADKLSKGLGTDRMEGYRFKIDQFILGELVEEPFEVVALDLSHINASYAELNLIPIDMVLGGDILTQLEAEIDYRSSELRLNY